MADNPNAPGQGASPPVDPKHPMYHGAFWSQVAPRTPATLRKVVRRHERTNSRGSDTDHSNDGSDASGESAGSGRSGGSNQSSASSAALEDHLASLRGLDGQEQMAAVEALLENPGRVVAAAVSPSGSEGGSPKLGRMVDASYHVGAHAPMSAFKHESFQHLHDDDQSGWSSDADLGLDADVAKRQVPWHWRQLSSGDIVDVTHLQMTDLQRDCLHNLSVTYGFTLRCGADFCSPLLLSTKGLREAHGGRYDALALLGEVAENSPCQGISITYEQVPADYLKGLADSMAASRCMISALHLMGDQTWAPEHWQAWIDLIASSRQKIEVIEMPQIHQKLLSEAGSGDEGSSGNDPSPGPADERDLCMREMQAAACAAARVAFNAQQDGRADPYESCIENFHTALDQCPQLRQLIWHQGMGMGEVYGAIGTLVTGLGGKLILPHPDLLASRLPFAEPSKLSQRSSEAHYLGHTLPAQLGSFSSEDGLVAEEVVRPTELTPAGWETFFKMIAQASLRMDGTAKNLTLDLHGMSPTESGLRTLADLLRANAPIGTLNISNNTISDKGMAALARGIQSNDHLRHLILNGVAGMDVSHRVIAHAIRDSSLITVDISGCHLDTVALGALVKACIDNGQIQQLLCRGVVVTDDEGRKLSESEVAKGVVESMVNGLTKESVCRFQLVDCGDDVMIQRDPATQDHSGFSRLVLMLPGTLRIPMNILVALNEALDCRAPLMEPNAFRFKERVYHYPPNLGRTIQSAAHPPFVLSDMIEADNVDRLHEFVDGIGVALGHLLGEDLLDKITMRQAEDQMDLAERVTYYEGELRRFVTKMTDGWKGVSMNAGMVIRRAVSWWLAFDKHDYTCEPMVLCLVALVVEDASVHGDLREYAYDARSRLSFKPPFSTDAFLYGQYIDPSRSYRLDQRAVFDRILNRSVPKPWLTQERALYGLGFLAFAAGALLGAWLALSVCHMSIPWLLGVTMLEKTASLWGVIVGVGVAFWLYRGFLMGAKPAPQDELDEAHKPFKVRMDGATRQHVLNFFGAELPVSRSPETPVHSHFSLFRPAPPATPVPGMGDPLGRGREGDEWASAMV